MGGADQSWKHKKGYTSTFFLLAVVGACCLFAVVSHSRTSQSYMQNSPVSLVSSLGGAPIELFEGKELVYIMGLVYIMESCVTLPKGSPGKGFCECVTGPGDGPHPPFGTKVFDACVFTKEEPDDDNVINCLDVHYQSCYNTNPIVDANVSSFPGMFLHGRTGHRFNLM